MPGGILIEFLTHQFLQVGVSVGYNPIIKIMSKYDIFSKFITVTLINTFLLWLSSEVLGNLQQNLLFWNTNFGIIVLSLCTIY